MSTTSLSAINMIAPSFSITPFIGSGLTLANGISPGVQAALAFAIGSAAGQCNIGWAEQIAVTSGTPFTLNLISANDSVFGNPMAMLHLCVCYFINLSLTTAQ